MTVDSILLQVGLEVSAKFQVVPCPMEKTVSYGKGTANGPSALIEASQELERSSICEHGIFTHQPIDCTAPQTICLTKLEQFEPWQFSTHFLS